MPGCRAGRWRLDVYTRIGSNKGKTPEHNQAKHTKHPHSLVWHNSTITTVFPSTLRNTLVATIFRRFSGFDNCSNSTTGCVRQHPRTRHSVHENSASSNVLLLQASQSLHPICSFATISSRNRWDFSAGPCSSRGPRESETWLLSGRFRRSPSSCVAPGSLHGGCRSAGTTTRVCLAPPSQGVDHPVATSRITSFRLLPAALL